MEINSRGLRQFNSHIKKCEAFFWCHACKNDFSRDASLELKAEQIKCNFLFILGTWCSSQVVEEIENSSNNSQNKSVRNFVPFALEA